MGVVQNVIGMVRDINDRKKGARVDEALKNYMNDPRATAQAVTQIAPQIGIKLEQDRITQQNAEQDRGLGTVRQFLRGLPEGSDVGEALDGISPFLQSMGVKPEMLAGYKQAVTANPNALMDDKAYGEMMKDRFSGTVVTPGSIYMRGGKEVTRAPYSMKSVNTPAGGVSTAFDPNTGEFGPAPGGEPGTSGLTMPAAGGAPAGAGGPLTVEALRPMFVAQESSGDYTAVNKDTGALGRYQIMPDTGRNLAKRVGVAWNPAMMRQDTPAARRYQDALGNAAIQESIDFGGGDPARVFSHYYGGPDTKKWGPKTRQYTTEMMDRLSGGRGNGAGANIEGSTGPTISRAGVINPKAAPAGAKTYRAATPDEIKAAGYPDGTAAQIGSDGKMVNLKTPSAAAQKATKFDYDRAGQALTSTNNLLAEVRRTATMPGLSQAVGAVQGRLPGWAVGSSGQDARNALEALRGNVGLQQLMQFKATSAQGASGFGNLSNQEGDRLNRAFGSLDDTSSDKQIQTNLKLAQDTLTRVSERIMWQMQRSEAGLDWKVPPEGTVRNGFEFMGGSPANRANWRRVKKGSK